MDYALILAKLFPDAEWSLNGDDFQGLIWLSESEPPSQELLDAAWPEVLLAETLKQLRQERDKRLKDCDWTQLPDAPVSGAEWKAYRQALREFPESVTDPFNPAWPVPPRELGI